jgi:hypothetical protein
MAAVGSINHNILSFKLMFDETLGNHDRQSGLKASPQLEHKVCSEGQSHICHLKFPL